MSHQNPANQLMDIAMRIRDMREILGYSMQKMAELTDISEEDYKQKEEILAKIAELEEIINSKDKKKSKWDKLKQLKKMVKIQQ